MGDTESEPVEFTMEEYDEIYDAIAEYDISLSKVNGLFRFITNDVSLSSIEDLSNIKYYVSGGTTTISAEEIFSNVFENAIVTYRPLISNVNIPLDFTRHLANELFGSPHAVDIFSNEEEIKEYFHNTKNIYLNERIANILTNSGTKEIPKTNDENSNNITKTLLEQIINNDSGRLTDLPSKDGVTSYTVPSGVEYYDVPIFFKSGDSLSYILTINPAEDQINILNLSSITIKNRIYIIKINLV